MNPVQTNSAETIPMEEIDDLLDEVLDPKGNDLFPSRVLDVLLHPGQYLAWFRSTTESFQKEAKVYISLSEKHAAQQGLRCFHRREVRELLRHHQGLRCYHRQELREVLRHHQGLRRNNKKRR